MVEPILKGGHHHQHNNTEDRLHQEMIIARRQEGRKYASKDYQWQ